MSVAFFNILPKGEINIFKNAKVLFSLRDFGFGVTTHPIQVRRGVDGLVEDFTYNEITDGTLLNWVTAIDPLNTGVVTRMVDQISGITASPKSVAVIPAVADSTGGRIVSEGVLQLINGKPAIKRFRPNDAYRIAYKSNIPTNHIFSVGKYSGSGNTVFLSSWSLTGDYIYRGEGSTESNSGASSIITDLRINQTTPSVLLMNQTNAAFANQSIFNFKADILFPSAGTGSNIALGWRPNLAPLGRGMFDFQEFILFDNYVDSLKIEEQQNEYYNVF